jgi:DNA mismatch repair protein MutS
MSIIGEYLSYQRKYQAQYDERTVVIMEIGTFYEIYGYDPAYCTSDEAKIDSAGQVWNEQIGKAVELSVVLNCVLTFEDGNKPYSIKNCHKVGFPSIALEKNKTTLLANDYTIVRIDQERNSKITKGHVTRFVAEIYSPTMQMDNITLTRPTSNIACIYMEYQQGMQNKYENFLVTTGAAVVDIITGQNRVCEFYSKIEDPIHAVQELYRFLISHYPRELIIHINDMPEGLSTHTEDAPNPYIKYLERVLELRRFDRLTAQVNAVPGDYKKLPYQIQFLNKIFTKQSTPVQTSGLRLNVIQKRNERIIEEMGLERLNYGRIAYMLLMQHCHSHNPDIIAKLAKPDLKWFDEHRHLILTHNAIVQLDLIPTTDPNSRLRKKSEVDSLMAVLDHNQTHLGRRSLHTLLQNPMLDPTEIQTYYDMVDEMAGEISMEQTANKVSIRLWQELDRLLKELPDIGRLQRKLEIKLINPKELAVLYRAYIKIINIYLLILKTKSPVLHKQMLSQEEVSSFNAFLARFGVIIDFDALEYCHIDNAAETTTKWMEFVDCPIRPGYYPDLDEQNQVLTNAEVVLQQIVDHLNIHLGSAKGKKIEFKASKKKQGAKKQDPTGTVITTTAAKATKLSNSVVDTNLCGVLQVLPYNSTDRLITSDKISALSTLIDQTRMRMRQRLLSIFDIIIEEMTTKYTFYVPIANLIAKLDLVHSYAKIAHLYNYHRPELITEGDASYLEAREIRHAIIERIIDGAYVTNDVYLGNGGTMGSGLIRSNGIELFGTNATGKSSLAKAVALLIIMAQIGCFVPAYLRFKPYSKIMTRLSENDNLFKGQSSFVVEMSELRTILRQADANTLVIGDELCCSTDSHSGMAICASAILSLVNSRSSFILASHMHELLGLDCIKELTPIQMQVLHLSISYDEVSKDLIYDRKLQTGPGDSVYGLIVARSLNLPEEFLNVANKVLLDITRQNDSIVATKHSRYNSKVYVSECSLCGKTCKQAELTSHHILEQSKADDRKLIGNMPMNAKDNLLVLCKSCHTNLHRTDTELETVEAPGKKIVRVKSTEPTKTLFLGHV